MVNKAKDTAKKVTTAVKTAVQTVTTKAKTTAQNVVNKVKETAKKATETAKKVTTAAKTTVQKAVTKVTTAVKTVVEKASNNAAKAAVSQSSHKESKPTVATKGTSTSQTKTTGNPRKQVTPEVRKAMEDAFDVHTVLDTVGFVPVVGEPADLINGLIYAAEKDYINAGISIAAVIPVAGDLGKAGKYGVKALKALDNGGDIAKLLREAIKKGPKLSRKNYKAKRIFVDSFEKYVKENADEAVEAAGKGSKKAAGKGGSKAIDNAIPNVQSATINPKKLTEYALNPNHPVGGNKAKVFESALGYNQSNADDLMRQIYEKLTSSEAVLGKLDEYGQRYTVDIPITGPNGNTVNVRTGWIIKTGSDIPELTTIYVKD